MPSVPTEQRDGCHAAEIPSGHSSNACPKRKTKLSVTQCGRNAIPETVTQQVNLFQRTGQKTAAQGPNLKDKKKEITWETNESAPVTDPGNK